MTSLIDVVFLLLVFFLFTSRFIGVEEFLPSRLPRNRGLETFPRTVKAEVVVDLGWKDGRAGATAFTTGPFAGTDDSFFAFGQVDDPRVGYIAPRFDEVEGYLAQRWRRYGPQTPVTVRFDDGLPWQMVVDVIDVCERVGLHDVTVGAEEIDP